MLWTWIAIVFGFFVWQNTMAHGLANWLLEWQYSDFARFRPTSTLIGMVLLAAIPAFIVYLLYWRRQNRRRIGPVSPVAATRFAVRQLRILLIMAGIAAVGAIASLLLLLTLPSGDGPIQPVSVSGPVGAPLPTGHASIDPVIPNGPQLRYTMRLLMTDYVVRYVPVSTGAGATSRLFVQIDDSGRVPTRLVGTMARNALPPSVRNVFIENNLVSPGPHYVLFTQPDQLPRPYLLAAVQFAIAGLVILLIALLQWNNVRRARRSADRMMEDNQAVDQPTSDQPAPDQPAAAQA
ncbi:hypothetical protein ACFOKI_11825 [Sphingomonas qilianensis]